MFYSSIVNEFKCLNSIKKTKCTTLKVNVYKSQISSGQSIYLLIYIYLRSIIIYCSLSLHFNWSPWLPPSCGSHRYRYFLSKRMQYFVRTSWALSFWCLLCCPWLLPSCLCLLCESIKQAELMTRSTWMLSLQLWPYFFNNNKIYIYIYIYIYLSRLWCS